MKYFKPFFLTLLMFGLILASTATAQTFDTPASIAEGSTYLHYSGEVDMTADGDSIASHHTQALYIADANQSVSGLQVVIGDSAGTEDINVFVEFSHDRLNWNQISTAAIDAAVAGNNTATIHDIGGSNLVEFDSAIYMRLHFDGQTGNPAGVLDWSLYLPKNTGAPLRGLGFTRDRRAP